MSTILPSRSDMFHCPELKRASCYSNPLTLPISRKSPSCKLHPHFKKWVGVSTLVNYIDPSSHPAPPQESPWVVHFLEARFSVSFCSKWRSDNERINQQRSTVVLCRNRCRPDPLVAFFASRVRLSHGV